MKKEVIVTAKSQEEAVVEALSQLGAPNAEALECTVIEAPKKGFLGIGAAPGKYAFSYTLKGAEVAYDFIRNLVNGMGLDAKVTLTEGDGENKLIRVDGESAGVLIGHHGDTLDSLQYLANLASAKKTADRKSVV